MTVSSDNVLQIEQIKIYMNLNIPGKENQQTPLTSGLLHNPLIKSSSNFSEYPFFTKNIVYPKAVLNRLGFNDRIEFFFNKDKFKKIIMQNRTNYFPEKLNMDVSDFDEEDVIIAYNIQSMIELLFPITEPIINNHINSLSKYIQEKTDYNFTFKGSTQYLNKFSPHQAGKRGVLVQGLQVQLFGPPCGVRRALNCRGLPGAARERALGFVRHGHLLRFLQRCLRVQERNIVFAN